MRDFIAAELSERYRIDREIGRGGNAIVYLAQDLRYDRTVAVKVLLPELVGTVRNERFLREIQIAAKLSHPHILTLHDSGEAHGTVYYVMPYVEGESLRELLRRERQLGIDVAVRIAREIASALAYAHVHGVVHRDIKPENILLHDGVAIVADFGIARALTEAATGQGLTQVGIAVGTPDYMSPEQAAGGKAVDGRTDLYALACMLYEMLGGRPPFAGRTPHEILARHAMDDVPRLIAARRDVPEIIEKSIMKALSKKPADRYATTGDFAAALIGQPIPSTTASAAPRPASRGLPLEPTMDAAAMETSKNAGLLARFLKRFGG
jgi:serine/threonine protein kinase